MSQYMELRDTLNTGDILLFSGNSPISKLIRFATRSRWSHVGMVFKNQANGNLFVYESTSISNVTDVDTGLPINGVQLTPLSKRLRTYEGTVAVRRLEDVDDYDQVQKTVSDIMDVFEGRPYEDDKLELANAALDLFLPDNEEDLSTLFCSELVAEIYQRLAFLSDKKPSNEYTPVDFALSDKALGLKKVSLGEPIELVSN